MNNDNRMLHYEWIAKVDTAIKISSASSSTLNQDEKTLISQGARVTGSLEGRSDGHWVVKDAQLDGQLLPQNMRFLFLGHWEQREVTSEPIVAKPSDFAATETPSPDPDLEKSSEKMSAVPTASEFHDHSQEVNPNLIEDSEKQKYPPKTISHRRLFALFKRKKI